jgi:hypothetical protein
MASNWGPLKVGGRYRVIRPFSDFDGRVHEVGEAWTYLDHNFLPYHDGHTLHVELPDGQKATYRFSDGPEEQSEVTGNLAKYIGAVE